MEKQKFKRDYFPDFRKASKKLEDAILDKDEKEEKKAIIELEILLRKIRNSEFADD